MTVDNLKKWLKLIRELSDVPDLDNPACRGEDPGLWAAISDSESLEEFTERFELASDYCHKCKDIVKCGEWAKEQVENCRYIEGIWAGDVYGPTQFRVAICAWIKCGTEFRTFGHYKFHTRECQLAADKFRKASSKRKRLERRRAE